MRESTLTRGIATALCGLWLWAVGIFPVGAANEDSVEEIKLIGGTLRISNFYDVDQRPKVEINGREFTFGGGSTVLYEKFRLSDREVAVFETNLGGSGTPSTYDILAVEFNGAVHQYEMLYPWVSPWDGIFIIKKSGNVLHFDLGYEKGFKVDAVLSSKGLAFSKREIARSAFSRNDCKWLFEHALTDCVARSGRSTCPQLDLSMAAVRGLNSMEDHPRWKIGGPRFKTLCAAACAGMKTPSYSKFASQVCEP